MHATLLLGVPDSSVHRNTTWVWGPEMDIPADLSHEAIVCVPGSRVGKEAMN